MGTELADLTGAASSYFNVGGSNAASHMLNLGRNHGTSLPDQSFFRHTPNTLLAQYFTARKVFGEFDFVAMSETRHDELFAAWLALSDAQRNNMDAKFRDIFEMSCEKGCHAILDEAKWHLDQDADPNATIAFTEKLAALANHIRTFFHHT